MFIIRRPTALIDLISNCNQDTAVLMLTFVKLRSRGKHINTFLSCTEKYCTTSNSNEVKLTTQAAMVGAPRAIVIQSAPASPHENLNRVEVTIRSPAGWQLTSSERPHSTLSP